MVHFDASFGDGLCDFCVPAGVAEWDYPASDFVMAEAKDTIFKRPQVSRGGWLACATCADLIEHGARGRLAERIGKTKSRKERREMARLHQRSVIDKFFEHRTGPRVEYTGPSRAYPAAVIVPKRPGSDTN